jgi:DNA-binding LytR/AlgR family response regulator
MSSKKYCFVVVDDNPNNVIVLNYLLQGNGLEGEIIYFENPNEALVFFESQVCDLLFLDVEMPEMTGFDFLSKLENPPYTIILTSYPRRYAEKAFTYLDKNLLDFVSKDQLIPSFSRIKERFLEKYNDQYIYVKCKDTADFFIRIPIRTIKYFEKIRKIINVVVEGAPEDTYYIDGSLEEIEELLPKGTSYRVRKSKLIMISHIKCYISGKINMGEDLDGNDIIIEVPHRERKTFINYFHARHSMIHFKE